MVDYTLSTVDRLRVRLRFRFSVETQCSLSAIKKSLSASWLVCNLTDSRLVYRRVVQWVCVLLHSSHYTGYRSTCHRVNTTPVCTGKELTMWPNCQGCTDTSNQDISALCVWCRSVSHFCIGGQECQSVSDSLALKRMRHFWHRIKICFECVKKVEPLYIRNSNGIKVLGKRPTKVVSD